MLELATRKYPQVRAKKIGLQELNFQEAFDLILCIDAMEMIFPEDWPKVLGNFHRALKQGGQLYFTVEIAVADAIEQDYQAGISAGLPVVLGESVVNAGEGENGYHYYPSLSQVRQWIVDANLTIQEEDEASDYHHYLVRKS